MGLQFSFFNGSSFNNYLWHSLFFVTFNQLSCFFCIHCAYSILIWLWDENISCRIDDSIILQRDPSISGILLRINNSSNESILLFYESVFLFLESFFWRQLYIIDRSPFRKMPKLSYCNKQLFYLNHFHRFLQVFKGTLMQIWICLCSYKNNTLKSSHS